MKSLKDKFWAVLSTDGKERSRLPCLALYAADCRLLAVIPIDLVNRGYGEAEVLRNGRAAYAILSRPDRRALLVPVREGRFHSEDGALLLDSTDLHEGSKITVSSLTVREYDGDC